MQSWLTKFVKVSRNYFELPQGGNANLPNMLMPQFNLLRCFLTISLLFLNGESISQKTVLSFVTELPNQTSSSHQVNFHD